MVYIEMDEIIMNIKIYKSRQFIDNDINSMYPYCVRDILSQTYEVISNSSDELDSIWYNIRVFDVAL